MKFKKAQIDDTAVFMFASGRKICGRIEYVPQATGDSWIVTEIFFKEEISVQYIQTFESMRIEQ